MCYSRDRFKQTLDGYCGLCIVGLYFLYLSVVKGALSVFDCTQNRDGVYILDADPSIICNKVIGWVQGARRSAGGRWMPELQSARMEADEPAHCTCVSCRSTQPGGAQEALKPAAALSIVVYTVGLPTSFLVILVRHRHAIHADQTLRMANQGGSDATNPNFHIRRRYQELYR
jgi:hypothetical protein